MQKYVLFYVCVPLGAGLVQPTPFHSSPRKESTARQCSQQTTPRSGDIRAAASKAEEAFAETITGTGTPRLPEALIWSPWESPPARFLPPAEPSSWTPQREPSSWTLGTLTSSLTTLPAATAQLLSHPTVHAPGVSCIRGWVDWTGCSAQSSGTEIKVWAKLIYSLMARGLIKLVTELFILWGLGPPSLVGAT